MHPDKTPSILITGCSSGIGAHAARALHQRGYRVFASARKPDDVARLREDGLESVQLDLDYSASIREAVNQVLEMNDGGLDALFNNGAYAQPGAVEDLSRDCLRAQFETNVFGGLELTNRVIPVMRRQGHGRIVMNSSILGLAALPYRGAYNASKFALEGITDTLRLELRGSGIHVSLIEPGPIVSRIRPNALPHFERHIDIEGSVHHAQYQKQLARLKNPGPAAPFTLGPEAVTRKLIHALESPRPRPRYYVTKPTWWVGGLRRVLSSRAMDRLMSKMSGEGRR